MWRLLGQQQFRDQAVHFNAIKNMSRLGSLMWVKSGLLEHEWFNYCIQITFFYDIFMIEIQKLSIVESESQSDMILRGLTTFRLPQFYYRRFSLLIIDGNQLYHS